MSEDGIVDMTETFAARARGNAFGRYVNEKIRSAATEDLIDRDVIYYPTLQEAIVARMAEWDGQSSQDLGDSFYGNELAGELGEALEQALGLVMVGIMGGRISNIVKKLDRERRGLVGSRATPEQLAEELADLNICMRRLAIRHGIDLDLSTARKFNATSEKNGLRTRVKEPT